VQDGLLGIAASVGHLYLDHGTAASGFWYDIRLSVDSSLSPAVVEHVLLGGEAAHWTDKVCSVV
jgi:hypothetical protein